MGKVTNSNAQKPTDNYKNHEDSGSIIPLKGQNKSDLIADPKEMKI